VRDLYEQYEDHTPQCTCWQGIYADRHMLWHAMYDTPAYRQHFRAMTPVHMKRSLPTTLRGVLDRMLSKSYISVLDAGTRAQLVRQVQAVFDGGLCGREMLDEAQGVWAYPYQTGTQALLTS